MFGVRILLWIEQEARAKEQERAVRLALLAHGADGQLLFPELFGAPQVEEVDDVAQSYANTEWHVPSSADEWDQVQAALAATRVSVPTPPDGGGWV